MTEGSRSACRERLISKLAVGNEAVGKSDSKLKKNNNNSNDYFKPSICNFNRFISRKQKTYVDTKLPTAFCQLPTKTS
jgi:hypothetical protein